MTTSLLWRGLVPACIVSWFCIGEFVIVCVNVLKVCVKVSAVVLPCLSWGLLPVVCDLQLYLPLWQSSSGEISLVHLVFLMLLSLCCCTSFPQVKGFYLQVKLVLWCHCEVLHLMEGSSCLWSVATQLPVPFQVHLFLGIEVLFHHRIFLQESFIINLLCSVYFWYFLFHVHSVFSNMSHLSCLNIW